MLDLCTMMLLFDKSCMLCLCQNKPKMWYYENDAKQLFMRINDAYFFLGSGGFLALGTMNPATMP
jgi:hypothetical protein